MRAPLRRTFAAALLCGLLAVTGCQYNQHRNLGATEKWVGSEVNYVTKLLGTPLLAIGDSLISPLTMIVDQLQHGGEQYHPDHHYLSYATSRTNARSEMGLGYQWIVMIPTFLIDTVYLPITGLIDLVAVLGFGDDGDDEYGETHSGQHSEGDLAFAESR